MEQQRLSQFTGGAGRADGGRRRVRDKPFKDEHLGAGTHLFIGVPAFNGPDGQLGAEKTAVDPHVQAADIGIFIRDKVRPAQEIAPKGRDQEKDEIAVGLLFEKVAGKLSAQDIRMVFFEPAERQRIKGFDQIGARIRGQSAVYLPAQFFITGSFAFQFDQQGTRPFTSFSPPLTA